MEGSQRSNTQSDNRGLSKGDQLGSKENGIINKMPNRKVQQIRCHIGVQIHHEVKTCVDADKNDCEMQLTPVGVSFSKLGVEKIVPFSNIHEITMAKAD